MTAAYVAVSILLTCLNLLTCEPIYGYTPNHHLIDGDYDNSEYKEHLRSNFKSTRTKIEVHAKQILGENAATADDAPYQLSLKLNDTHHCGAALLEADSRLQYAITAAHCVCEKGTNHPTEPSSFTVHGGNVDRYQGIEIGVKDIVVHPRYDGQHRHDIALIFFDGMLTLNKRLHPTRLPEKGEDTIMGWLAVTGWGKSKENADVLDNLRIVELPLVDQENCGMNYRRRLRAKKEIYFTTFCLGLNMDEQGACISDDGGPAVAWLFNMKLNNVLIGVSSYRMSCENVESPGVFTSVYPYVEWIVDKASEHYSGLSARERDIIRKFATPLI